MGIKKLPGLILFSAFVMWTNDSFSQQLNLPLNRDFSIRYECFLNNTDSLSYHSAVKPLIENATISYQEYRNQHATKVKKHFAYLFKDKSWIKRKMKWENLVEVEGNEFDFDVNPIFNFEYGRDLANDNSQKYFKNSRGFMVNAHLTNKVSFSTSFYENQMYVPTYLRTYASSISTEAFSGVSWKPQNPIMPGQGRVKPFKTRGYDFAYAQGYVSYSPSQNVNLQFGNGKLFIGEGYRSMLLSDNAFNYPFFRATSTWLKGKIQYSTIYAALTNPRRIRYFTTPEAYFEKKAATFNYLSLQINKKLQIGLFEGTIFRRVNDNQELQKVDPQLFNPLIGLNTIIGGFEGDASNSLLGINIKYLLAKKWILYGQVATDNPADEKYAYQIGTKIFDAFNIEDLFIQAEINHSSRKFYGADDSRMSYSHFNQPLAYTLGGGSFETVLKGSYRTDDHWYEYQFGYQTYRYYENGPQVGRDVLLSDNTVPNPSSMSSMAKLFFHDVRYNYVVNPNYNMVLTIGWFHRGINKIELPYKTSYLYVGFRTSLSNFYYDL